MQQTERHARDVRRRPQRYSDGDGDDIEEGEELLESLDSLFRNVLSKRFGHKASKAFFKHVYPLVEDALLGDDNDAAVRDAKEILDRAKDRSDGFGGEYAARPVGARPFASGELGGRRPVAVGEAGGGWSSRRDHHRRGGRGRHGHSYEEGDAIDWLDFIRELLF